MLTHKDALSQALEQIETIGAKERAYQARLAADRRYQFLLATVVATRLELHEEDYGWGGFDRIAYYRLSSVYPRHKRAVELMHARRAKLFNGSHNHTAKRLAYCASQRRVEVMLRIVEAPDRRNLRSLDATLKAIPEIAA